MEGKLLIVNHFLNKRFFKAHAISSDFQLGFNDFSQNVQQATQRSLLAFEGAMLPTDIELNLAAKSQFDVFTITNFAGVEIAQDLGFRVKILSLVKRNLGNREEEISPSFLNASDLLPNGQAELSIIGIFFNLLCSI